MGLIWTTLPLAWRLGAIGLAALALVGTIGGFVYKIKHDAVVAERVKVEAEKRDAIRKAGEARDRVRELCIDKPVGCVPDDWFRD